MADLFGTLPPELALEQQRLNRQQKMAEMLLAQGAQPQAAGQMVSGRYVPNSFFQNLQGPVNMMLGAYMANKGDKAALDLAKQLREAQSKMGEQYFEALQGKPATYGADIPTETYETVKGSMISPATGPDYRKAFTIATDPYAPKWLQAQAAEMLKEQKVGPEETVYKFNFATGQREPVIQGMPKVSQDIKDIARQAKLDVRNIDNWSDQDWQKIRNIEQEINQSKRTVINMPSEGERKAGTMANILDKNILQMQTALGVDPKAVKPNVPASVVEAITGPNLLSRAIKPTQRQIIEDSQLDVLDAALTLRTGAAYTREQLNAMRDTYFPTISDKPATIAAKKQRLETLLDSAYIAAGRATPPRVSEPYQAPTKTTAQQLNVPKIGGAKAPTGVDQAVWDAMTPQEKQLWK